MHGSNSFHRLKLYDDFTTHNYVSPKPDIHPDLFIHDGYWLLPNNLQATPFEFKS